MLRATGVLFFAMCSVTAFAADKKPVAELFPPHTLLYAELRDPAQTANSLSSLFEGTPLAEGLNFGHDRRDAALTLEDLPGVQRSGQLAVWTSGEALAELKRISGAAIAVTSFEKKTGIPNIAFVILTGENSSFGLLMKSYLLTSPDIRRMGKIDGVPFYQNRQLTLEEPKQPGAVAEEERDPVPALGKYEATYLYAPGLIVIGSNKASVEDVLVRFKAKENSKSLKSDAVFTKQNEAFPGAGVFFFARPEELEKQLGDAAKNRKPLLTKSDIAGLRFLLNFQGLETVAGLLSFPKDSVKLSLSVHHKNPASSPLFALLGPAPANAEHLRLAAKSGIAGLTFPLPPKGKRTEAILGVLDSLAKAAGQLGALPSEILADSGKVKLPLKEMLEGVAGVTIYQPAGAALPKGVEPLPMLALHLQDEASAKLWETDLSKVIATLTNEEAGTLSSETIAGIKVFGTAQPLPGRGSTPIHFARKGHTVLLGLDLKRIAANLAELDSAKLPSWAKPSREAVGIGFFKLETLLDLFVERWTAEMQPWELTIPDGLWGFGGLSPFSPFPPDAKAAERRKQQSASRGKAMKAWEAVPPAFVELQRNQDVLHLSAHWTDFRKDLPKAIEALLIWIEHAVPKKVKVDELHDESEKR